MMEQDNSVAEAHLHGQPGRKHIILVTGMHRSGTSAVTRALNICGAAVPSELWEAKSDNPDGFWESRPVVLLHEELLASIGFTWDDIRPFPEDWFDTAAAARFRDRLWDAVRDDLTVGRPLLVKDPRLCRLVPLWSRIGQEHEVELSFVVPLRSPLDVAESLARRDQMPRAKALLLWARHFLEAERATRGRHRCFVAYERLMNDGVATISAVARALQLAASPLSPELAEQVSEFLNAARWHHRRMPDQTAPDWIKLVHDWGMRATCGIEPDAATLDVISDGLSAATAIYQPLVERIPALERLVADQNTAIGTLETARISWDDERSRLHQERLTLHDERRKLYDERRTLYDERVTLLGEQVSLRDERLTLRDERLALQDERGSLHNERQSLHDERQSLHDEQRALRDERQSLYDEQRALRDERQSLHDERSRFYAERSDLLAAREMMTQTLQQTEQAKSAIINSTSWRLTAPLRALGRLARPHSGSGGTA
jgi:hypothetical protein